MARSGYYFNSLKDWKKTFEREQRKAQARLDALVGQGHPVAEDQEALMEIRTAWIKQIDQELATQT